MKPLNLLKKSFALFIVLSLVVSLANTYSTQELFSNSFMDVESPSVIELYDIQGDVRKVASAESELPASQYLPANNANRAMIDRTWEITRITNEKQEVIYDVLNNEEDKNKLLELEFEMVGTSQVRIDGDDSLIFEISLLHEKGLTIALFRSFGEGFEIIEARKREIKRSVIRAAKNIFTKEKTFEVKKEKVVEGKKGVFFKHVGQPLILERAIVPKINHGVFRGLQVRGEIILGEDSIESLNASIALETPDAFELPHLDYVKVNDGGQFSYEDDNGKVISGVITNNGSDGYRIRIATGPHAGTMLNFVTSEELDRIQQVERERRLKEEEIRQQNADKPKVSTSTFFSSQSPTRLPASN